MNPKWLRGAIEGLLSDDGADAKKCEGDFASFGSAVIAFVGAAVESAKDVEAVVRQAQQMCSPVEQDAKRLVMNLFQDLTHPKRIMQNIGSTRSEFYDELGKSLVLLAQKDFRGSGDNVGMAVRRALEGAQPTESPPYTKLANLNCWKDHGAVDLENTTGLPCGIMSIEECEKKCDSLPACQGITIWHIPNQPEQVQCFRRGSVQVDKCDTGANGFDTFVNKKVEAPASSPSIISSMALYAVAHWGLASTQHSDMVTALTPENFGNFLEGVLEGLMSDGDDFSKCAAEVPVVASTLKKAMVTVATAAFKAIAAATEAGKTCVVVLKEGMKLAGSMFNDIRHPTQIFQNIANTETDFLIDLGKGLEALAVNDFPTSGTLMGMALRRALEGNSTASVVIV
jgi:hypothetical protein